METEFPFVPPTHPVRHGYGPLAGELRMYPPSAKFVGCVQLVSTTPEIVTREAHYKPTGVVENGVEFWDFSHFVPGD